MAGLEEVLAKKPMKKVPCDNCLLYKWECDMSKPKQCKKCKMVNYCSRICQLEHWNKVHRKHCKYLAGTKVKDKAGHKPNFCPKCQIGQGVNKEKEFSSPNSGIFPCMFVTEAGSLKNKFHDAIVMGEISGKFTCQAEHCFSIFTHCCLKLAHIHPQIMGPIFSKLASFRDSTLGVGTPNEKIQETYICDTFHILNDLFDSIQDLLIEHFSEDNKYEIKWWTSLLLFKDILETRMFWSRYKYPQEAAFKASVDPVLKAASLRMPPYEELAQLMQGEGVCEGCQNGLNEVDEVDEQSNVSSKFPTENGWVFLSHKGFQFSCAKCIDHMMKEEIKIARAAQAEMNSMPNACHQCGMLCKGRPRCRYCQSKVYCSEECQSADWEIHEMFCKDIQEAAAGGEGGRRLSKREIDKAAEEKGTEGYLEAKKEEMNNLMVQLNIKL